MPEDSDIFMKAMDKWGWIFQVDMAIEEMSELTRSICKYKRNDNKSIPDNLLEEIADVKLMMMQLECMFGKEEVSEILDKKLKRLKRMLKNA